jgi:hypothetical protein
MKTVLALAFCLSTTVAHAITVAPGGVSITGPDCDPNNTTVAFSPDFSTFSILYQSMETSTVGVLRRVNSNPEEYDPSASVFAPPKRCNVKIAFRPAAGKQLELQQIDYRAYVNVPDDKSYAVIESKHRFLQGSLVTGGSTRNPSEWYIQGNLMLKQGPYDGEFVWSARYAPTATRPDMGLHVSNCTGVADFVIETTVRGHVFNSSEEVYVMLDSADGTLQEQSAVYKIAEKNCDATNRRRDRVCRNGRC